MIETKQDIIKETTLTPAAKIFYLWLQLQEEDIFTKGNIYFAKEFDVTTMTIINWLFSLEAIDYLEIQYYKRKRKLICKY